MTSSFFRDDHTALVRHRALGYAREPDNTFRSIPNNLTALGSSSLFSGCGGNGNVAWKVASFVQNPSNRSLFIMTG